MSITSTARATAGVIGASVAVGAFVLTAQGAPSLATVADTAQAVHAVAHHHRGIWVERAPRDVCESALNVRRCWWYTGTESQVVFDAEGLAVTS
jgi:hypothetical protein